MPETRSLKVRDGRIFREGDVITVDGTNGEVLAGTAEMLEPALDEWFRTLLHWADNVRDIGVRANADTPDDARTARMFEAEGIGLCRTEHMFFDEDRLTVMREMIFADTVKDRKVALDRLLPMQRADFIALFDIMAGLPVCIRLFDPPLHEFLPQDREGLRELAEALDRPLSEVTRRVEALSEFNPMLGMRGVRIGITVPEIYEMQARAIFEATVEASKRGAAVVPEMMIPLVSAKREVELVKTRVDAVAAAVRTEYRGGFRLPARRHGRNPARRPPRRRDRPARGLPVVRDKRPHPDDLRSVARRCRSLHGRLCAAGGLPRGSVPRSRRGRRRRIIAHRERARARNAT